MKIELKNENELDDYIICHRCNTLYHEIEIAERSKALCSQCGSVLYSHNSRVLEQGLAWSITGLIFFILANSFPIVKINILGSESFITIISMITSMIKSGYYLVGIFVLFLILIFPLMIFLLYILIFSLMKMGRCEEFTKDFLILLANIQPWHMSDIFLISILVALVKLLGMADIHIGISFWTLSIFVLIDIYLTRSIHLGDLWMLREHIYHKETKESSCAVC
ncbi:MAG: paraquat-inducible protein A [Campylobacterota bacterium]|nr:paraquat-inducible protein A [Campylobacterota bacterium]